MPAEKPISDTSLALKYTAKAGEAIAKAYKGKIKAESAKLLIYDIVLEAIREARKALEPKP